jgi:LPXTG-motif cell wall-anchored protein
MKRFKKMMAIVIVAVMTMTFAVPMTVFGAAGDASFDNKIEVKDLTAGDVVTYYQVLEWDATSPKGWKFKAPFNTLTDADLTEILGTPADNTTTPPTEAVPGKITQAMAEKIAAKATAASAISGGTVADESTTWSKDITALTQAGLYMVVATPKEPGVVYNPAFVASDFVGTNSTNSISIEVSYPDTSYVKKENITVNKTTSDEVNVDPTSAIDSYVGQEVTFYVDTTIPVFVDGYGTPSFVIDDKVLTNGIELKADTILITLGNREASPSTAVTYGKEASDGIVEYNDSIFTVTPNNKIGYNVTFKDTYLKGLTTAVPVHIEYKGTITNEAAFNVNEDNNEVTVTYNNGYNTNPSALRDRTNHYTFSIGAKALGYDGDKYLTYELEKTGVDRDGKPVVESKNIVEWETQNPHYPLAGATFGLYTDPECNTPYRNGHYNENATCTTGEDGIISFYGLAQGTYYMKETNAPQGFLMDTRITEIKITAEYEEETVPATVENGIKVAGYKVDVLKSYTVSVDNVSIYDSTKEIYTSIATSRVNTYTFEENEGPTISHVIMPSTYEEGTKVNTKGVELPSTGGMGTTLFYIIGAILIIGAGVLLVTRRRVDGKE